MIKTDVSCQLKTQYYNTRFIMYSYEVWHLPFWECVRILFGCCLEMSEMFQMVSKRLLCWVDIYWIMFTLIAQIISSHIILCSFGQRNVVLGKSHGKFTEFWIVAQALLPTMSRQILNTHLIAFEIDCSVPTNRNDAGSSIQGSL